MPYRIKALAGKPYCPSNGEEGMWFHDRFCDDCEHDKDYRENQLDSKVNEIGAYGCLFIALSVTIDCEDPDYPPEWTHTEDGVPICTAFEKELPDEVREFKRTEQEEFLPGMEVKS